MAKRNIETGRFDIFPPRNSSKTDRQPSKRKLNYYIPATALSGLIAAGGASAFIDNGSRADAAIYEEVSVPPSGEAFNNFVTFINNKDRLSSQEAKDKCPSLDLSINGRHAIDSETKKGTTPGGQFEMPLDTELPVDIQLKNLPKKDRKIIFSSPNQTVELTGGFSDDDYSLKVGGKTYNKKNPPPANLHIRNFVLEIKTEGKSVNFNIKIVKPNSLATLGVRVPGLRQEDPECHTEGEKMEIFGKKENPTSSPTRNSTTAVITNTITPTSATNTPVSTTIAPATSTPSELPIVTRTPQPTETQPVSPTITNTATRELTPTSSPRAVESATPTITATKEVTRTPELTSTPTITLTPGKKETIQVTPTFTPTPGGSGIDTRVPTEKPEKKHEESPIATPTSPLEQTTPVPTVEAFPTPSQTAPLPTETATAIIQKDTPTPVPSVPFVPQKPPKTGGGGSSKSTQAGGLFALAAAFSLGILARKTYKK